MQQLTARWSLPLITLFCLLIIGAYLYQRYQYESVLLVQQHGIALDVAYRATLDKYHNDVSTRYYHQILDPGVLTLLREAADTSPDGLPRIRGRLFRLLYADYQKMVSNGLSHFYFYLPDGSTLLRFHAPAQAGENAREHHPLLQAAHASGEAQRGFAVGTNSSPAFRYVFPIIEQGHYYGSVEFAMPFERIHDNLIHLVPDGDYTMLINRNALGESGDALLGEKFIRSALGSQWLCEHPTLSRITRNFGQSETSTRLMPILADNQALFQQMARGKSTSIPLIDKGKGYVISLYGIQTREHETIAWILGISETPLLISMRNNMLLSGMVTTLLVLLLSLSSWVILQQRNRLHALSHIDGLTGIANRRSFDLTLTKEWQRACRTREPLALLLVDIDFFKQYNDQYGHQAGDRCLRLVARTIQENLTRAGDLAARYGGEEFACILPNTGRQGAVAIAERLREQIRHLQHPHATSEVAEILTVSIGIAVQVPDSTLRASHLVRQADEQLYAAKEIGRDCVAH